MTGVPLVATLATAVGCGLVSGVFFAFSSFIMPALDRLPAAQGVEAMQSVNRLAVTPPFMAALFAPALACLALMVWAGLSWDEPGAWWVLAGGALYLLGAIAVTIAANVPLNDMLASLQGDDPAAQEHWSEYVAGWTAWNHVRAAAAFAAAVMLTIAVSVD